MHFLSADDAHLMAKVMDPMYGREPEPKDDESIAPGGASARAKGEVDYFSWYADEMSPELKRRLEKEARERQLRAYLAAQDAPDAWWEFRPPDVPVSSAEVVGALMRDLLNGVMRKCGDVSARRRASQELERAAAGKEGAAGELAQLRARLQGGLLEALPPRERAEMEAKLARAEQLARGAAEGGPASARGGGSIEEMRRRSLAMEAQMAELNALVRSMQGEMKEAAERREVEERLRTLEQEREARAKEERLWLFSLVWEAFVAEIARREGRTQQEAEEARRREEEERRRQEEQRRKEEEERQRREAEAAKKKKSGFCSVM